MARQIVWSRRAQNDRKAIFTYWNKANKSKVYSTKLNALFVLAVEFVAKNPHTGKMTSRNDVRVKFVNHFAIVYESNEIELFVLAVFDTRQSPDKFDKILQKK